MPRLVDLVKSGTFDDYIEEEKKARQNIVNVTMPKIPASTGVQKYKHPFFFCFSYRQGNGTAKRTFNDSEE